MDFNFFKASSSLDGGLASFPGTGYLDSVEERDGRVAVKGWGLARKADMNFIIPDKFFIFLDNRLLGHCLPNLARHDVREAYSLPGVLDNCGFECGFTLEEAGVLNRLSVHYMAERALYALPGPYACVYPLLTEAAEYDVKIIEGLAISLTTRCNLRCEYCFIQYPDYVYEDMDAALLDGIFSMAKEFSVKEIHYGIMGEPTVYKNLPALIRDNIAGGYRVSVASNLAAPLSEDELEAFLGCHRVEVSVDSFGRSSRGGDPRTILMNLCRLSARALVKKQKGPDITFSVVLNELNAPDLSELAGIARGVGVCAVQLLDMRKPWREADFSSLPPRLTESKAPEALRASLREALLILREGGLSVSIDALLQAFLDRAPLPEGAAFSPTAPDKPTRLCIAPWSRMYIYADGHATPCYHFSSVGKLDRRSTLTDILNGPRMRSIRKELLSGQLASGCQDCARAAPATLHELRRLVSQFNKGARSAAETFGQPVDFT